MWRNELDTLTARFSFPAPPITPPWTPKTGMRRITLGRSRVSQSGRGYAVMPIPTATEGASRMAELLDHDQQVQSYLAFSPTSAAIGLPSP